MGVYRRGKNWYIDFTFHGRRIREMIGSRKDAEKVIAKKKTEINENKFLDVRKEPEPITFYEFAKEYLEWCKANHKPSSRTRELSNIRVLDATFGKKNLTDITAWDIEKWKQKRKGQKKINRLKKPSLDSPVIKPGSVNRELALLKGMLNKAVEWGRLKESPARKVKGLKGVANRLRYLMPDELQRFISNCADHLKPVVTVAAHTGMRRGEISSLRWNQIDFEKGIITLTDTKNNESRYVPMNETAKTTLASMREGKGKDDYVFPGLKPESPLYWIDLSFHRAAEKSGIEDFHFHDLRHTFASNLVMAGTDLMTVKELLGHKTIEMTLRYAHLAPDHKAKAVNILDQVFDMSQDSPQEKEPERKVVEFKR